MIRPRHRAAWTAPDVAAAWYPIAAFPIAAENTPVRLAVDGAEVIGHLGIERGSRKLAWLEPHASGAVLLIAPWRHPSHHAAGLPRRYPSAWQPFGAWRWPLPAPLAAPVPVAMPERDPDDPPPVSETDGWPYPDLALGRAGTPSGSRDETEARVLRALRTCELMTGRVGHAVGGISGDWNWEWYGAMRRRQRAEELEELRAAGRIDTDLATVRAAFAPTARDRDDVDTALTWVRRSRTPHAATLLLDRAANPPFSWRQIATRHRRIGRKSTCQALYARALDEIHAIARLATITPGDPRA